MKGFNLFRKVSSDNFNTIAKVVELIVIFGFISFNYSLLRGLKDVFVYNLISKESIYPLKVLVIPCIFLFTMLYTFIAKRVDRDSRFYIVISYFFLFFFIWVFVLYPNRSLLPLDGLARFLSKYISYSGIYNCFRYWYVSLFYIHAELWGTIVLGVTFWSFANEVTSVEQAKKIYPILTAGAAMGAICSGLFMFNFSDDSDIQLNIILFLILGILAIYINLSSRVGKDVINNVKKQKKILSFAESIKVLLSSRYLMWLACIVFGYNMFIVFLECIWKGRVGSYETEMFKCFISEGYGKDVAKAMAKNKVTVIYGVQSILTGLFSLLWILFVVAFMSKDSKGGNVAVKKSSGNWLRIALFTPVTALISSLLFFITFKNSGVLNYVVAHFLKVDIGACNDVDIKNVVISSLLVLIFIGLVFLCFIKSSKYVFFDTSKERAYIPLDKESKTSGKAAIDAIGSRLAKGSGALLISLLSTLFGGLDSIVNIAFCFVFFLIFLWIISVLKLNPLYEQKCLEKEKENSVTEKKDN